MGGATLLFEVSGLLFVGALHLPFQFVVGVVDGPAVAHERFGLNYALEHLLVLAHDLVAAHQPQLVLLQLTGCYYVGQVLASQRR